MAERVVVVTGASAGIGRAAAIAFGQLGDAVALVAEDEGTLADVAAEVEAAGGRAFPVVAHLGDYDQVETAARLIEERFGAIDIWVNDTVATVCAPFREIAPEVYRHATDVAYLGTVHGTMAALKRMMLRDRGVVIQVGSALAHHATPLQSPSCGAAFAIRGFTESVRAELGNDGSRVRLSMVRIPASPVSAPEVAARAIVLAAALPHRELWVGWPTAISALASRLMPRLLATQLARWGKRGQGEPTRAAGSRHPWRLAGLGLAGLSLVAVAAVVRKR